MERRRVVVTGVGAISPLGLTMAQTWRRLLAGESGIGPITRFDARALGLPVQIAGEVRCFDPADYIDAKAARRMDRFCQLGVASAAQAVADARLPIDERTRDDVAVYFATGAGGIATIVEQENVRLTRGAGRVSPFTIPAMMSNAVAGQIGLQLGIRGPGVTHASACASSNDAIGMAMAAIQAGWAQAVLTGGAEAPIIPLAVAGFVQAGALSSRFNETPQRASRPFDRLRDGFVISEMATTLVLEELEYARARGASIIAEVAGYGASMDAFHLTAPPPEGHGAVRAMTRALATAGVGAGDVDYISAHGTSTPLNDLVETVAIKTVFGEHAPSIPISSIKSMVGHSAGACGALEAAACVYTIRDGVIPPTINYEQPDPECDLDYVPNEARVVPVRVAISNSFGFGGHNSCLVFHRME